MKLQLSAILLWILCISATAQPVAQPSSLNNEALFNLPANVHDWMNIGLKNAKQTASKDFFRRDTVRLIGYIKGYTRDIGFNSGIIYASNVITREDLPTVITIHDDGRFETNLPVSHPVYSRCIFNNRRVQFYAEPGQTLAIVLEAKDLTAEMREVSKIQYAGVAAPINNELLSVKLTPPDYPSLAGYVSSKLPVDFNQQQIAAWKKEKANLEQEMTRSGLSTKARSILINELAMQSSAYILDYLLDRRSAAIRDTANPVLKVKEDKSFYTFLKDLPLNDPALLATTGFSTFVNRFEFSTPFTWALQSKGFEQYLFEELALQPTAEDLDYIGRNKEFNRKINSNVSKETRDSLLRDFSKLSIAFSQKYSSYREGYRKKYPLFTLEERPLADWAAKDRALAEYFGLEANLVYQIAKVRSLKYSLKEMIKDKDKARLFLTALEEGIPHPFMLSESERMFEQAYPAVQHAAYDIPDRAGASIFRNIIDQYKGKTLVIDFWATSCGPCVAYLKSSKVSRSVYDNSKDLAFIYITSDKESPLASYTSFVKDNNMKHTYRLQADDYLMLRQLFKFNGIPRYMLIRKDGKVIDDDFRIYDFEFNPEKFVGKN